MRRLRIAVTGAQGFIGSHLRQQLRELGHTVVPLVRTIPTTEPEWVRFSLEDGVAGPLSGFDALIHCAYDFPAADARESDRRNVEGSTRLFQSARAAGIRHLIFVSTLSAFPGCRSHYGRGKLAVERVVSELGGISIRLGFVYDESGRGLSGKLKRLAGRLPVMPIPGTGRQKLYPLSALDLGPSVITILERAKAGSVIPLAQSEPVTFADLLRRFASQSGKRVVLFPTPWQPLWLGLRCLEVAGIRLSFRSDSLLSLVNQNPNPDFSIAHELGLRPKLYPEVFNEITLRTGDNGADSSARNL